MKKHLLLLCIAFTGITTYGQNSVPNGNFENWTTFSYDYPQNYTYNSNMAFSDFTTPNVTKTTDAYHGTYAAKLTNLVLNGDTMFGFIVNANVPGKPSTAHGGLPFSQKPKGIRGWYKYNVATSVDSGTIILIFSHGGQNIGTYYFEIGGVHSSYTMFNFNLSPALSVTPDSVIIGILSCKYNITMNQPHGIPGSTLFLDSMSFTGVSSQPTWLNGDFESWETQSMNTPDQWNVNGGFNTGVWVTRTTDAAKGSYAIELKTYLGNNNNKTEAQASWISTGYYPNNCKNNCHEKGGYPFSNITDTLAFYYKYAPAHPKDSASININFKKNGLPVDGRYIILLASASYKYVEVPFILNQSPDTVIIDIQSSMWQDTLPSYVGADLKIDEIYFKSQKSTGIHQLKNEIENSISIFPNPSNGKFQIKGTRTNIQTLKIFDVLGKEIYSNSKFNLQKSNEVDLSQFQKGIYFVKVYDGLNNYTEKIVIK